MYKRQGIPYILLLFSGWKQDGEEFDVMLSVSEVVIVLAESLSLAWPIDMLVLLRLAERDQRSRGSAAHRSAPLRQSIESEVGVPANALVCALAPS